MSGEAGPALKGWIGLGALVGLVAPAVVLAVDRTDPDVREALGPSLGVLGAQAVVERAVGADRPQWVRRIGTVGTAARLALYAVAWRGPRRRLLGAPRRRTSVLLGANLAFWSANLIVLAILGRRSAG